MKVKDGGKKASFSQEDEFKLRAVRRGWGKGGGAKRGAAFGSAFEKMTLPERAQALAATLTGKLGERRLLVAMTPEHRENVETLEDEQLGIRGDDDDGGSAQEAANPEDQEDAQIVLGDKFDGRSAPALHGLGTTLLRMDKASAAERVFELLTQLYPNDLAANLRRGSAAEQQKVQAYLAILARGPDPFGAHLALAHACAERLLPPPPTTPPPPYHRYCRNYNHDHSTCSPSQLHPLNFILSSPPLSSSSLLYY
jgi:hypothetical protein